MARDFFRDKIVILGNDATSVARARTPLGRMSRAEALAQVTDVLINHRWIKRIPLAACSCTCSSS